MQKKERHFAVEDEKTSSPSPLSQTIPIIVGPLTSMMYVATANPSWRKRKANTFLSSPQSVQIMDRMSTRLPSGVSATICSWKLIGLGDAAVVTAQVTSVRFTSPETMDVKAIPAALTPDKLTDWPSVRAYQPMGRPYLPLTGVPKALTPTASI